MISMKIHAFRLKRGADLKKGILNYASQSGIKAGAILTCVGSLSRATIRMANATVTNDYEKAFEIVSLVGTLGNNSAHLHISLSDAYGACIGGHLKDNCIVATTAEIVIGEFEEYSFTREQDKESGYDELVVGRRAVGASDVS